jgi:hypothetical protein
MDNLPTDFVVIEDDEHEVDCECSECAYDRECDEADTYNDSVV